MNFVSYETTFIFAITKMKSVVNVEMLIHIMIYFK